MVKRHRCPCIPAHRIWQKCYLSPLWSPTRGETEHRKSHHRSVGPSYDYPEGSGELLKTLLLSYQYKY